jgi:glycine oxidase
VVVKPWDVIVTGGGVIGLSLAWELGKRGASVLVVEKGELGCEASRAAGGMLAWCDPHLPEPVRALARLSASCYGDFVREIEETSGLGVDLRRNGTIVIEEGSPAAFVQDCRDVSLTELAELDPALNPASTSLQLWPEWSVDPRRLMDALAAACRVQGVEMQTGITVTRITSENGRASGVPTTGVETTGGSFTAGQVVNCAGAWAGQLECGLEPSPSPTHPVKGQMLALEAEPGFLRHVVRSPEVYLIPRSDGHIVVGATVQQAGFDKETTPAAIDRLRRAAVNLVPKLASARLCEAWAGLRPGSPDNLPILGKTSLPGYFIASGHFRDGILLAPGTARIMSKILQGEKLEDDFAALSPNRFVVGAAVAR